MNIYSDISPTYYFLIISEEMRFKLDDGQGPESNEQNPCLLIAKSHTRSEETRGS